MSFILFQVWYSWPWGRWRWGNVERCIRCPQTDAGVVCHCKELEMTAVFWEQSGQEAEASCFHLRGATVSSSYFTLCQLEPEFSETLSTGCQLLFCNAKRTWRRVFRGEYSTLTSLLSSLKYFGNTKCLILCWLLWRGLEHILKIWPLFIRDHVYVNTGTFTTVPRELFFFFFFSSFPSDRENLSVCLYLPWPFSHHGNSLPEAKDQHWKIVTFCSVHHRGYLCCQTIFFFFFFAFVYYSGDLIGKDLIGHISRYSLYEAPLLLYFSPLSLIS